MSELTDLQAYLVEAKAVYHKRMLGETVLVASSPDGSVTYNQLSAKQLEAYITKLESQIAALEGTSSSINPRGPIHFVHPS